MRAMKWAWAIPLALALGACGVATQGPTVNSGFPGWPAGYGYPPVTAEADQDAPCSVTVYGPTLPHSPTEVINRHAIFVRWPQRYGGNASCAARVRKKSLLIAEQVRARNGTWFTIVGSAFTTTSTKQGSLRIARRRPAVIDHVYRAVAHAVLILPSPHPGCASDNSCTKSVLVTAVSQIMPAQYP